ncbi:autophagy-related protein 27 [Aspergillus cavernicola]|uniref:Autophagy-related protein 27 n=1 Tax=Aspergillus cavernicola TaxID=176166 RepID=A0ABR4I8P4_9EURO
MRISSISLLSAASLLPSLAAALTFDCAHITKDTYKYNLSPLKGAHSIYHAEIVDGSIVNTTYVLNVCNILGGSATRVHLHCGTSRNICGFHYKYDSDGQHETSFAFPIAGLDHMGHGAKDPEVTRLKTIDAETEGLRVKLSGGEYPVGDKKVKSAAAVVDFVCDPDRSGLEGLNDSAKRLLRAREEAEDGDENSGDGDGEGDDGNGEDKGPFYDGSNPDRSLQFKSFNQTDDESYVLNLSWRTRYACDSYSEGRENSSGHWGFFTWFIIIFFLCAAAYLVFGSWLNYNRYGARGWDLLPHGDTVRDVPYLFQDWLRRVVNTFQGAGSRGGYSAV